MHYTVYKTINTSNGKFYIGSHKTKNIDDLYIGSGKILRRAIAKHGIKCFKKTILAILNTSKEMYALENELVAIALENPLCMNIKAGGLGGFDYINENNLHSTKEARKVLQEILQADPYFLKRVCRQFRENNPKFVAASNDRLRAAHDKAVRGMLKSWPGSKHSLKTRKLMSEKKQGRNNNQFGKIWIYNTTVQQSKCITKDMLQQYLATGRQIGRKIKFT